MIGFTATPLRSGYSNTLSAYICWAVSPTSHSINFMALALFGAYLASTTPETFTSVPSPSKVGSTTRVASAQGFCAALSVIRPAATWRAVSRSPPEGFCARLALRTAQPLLGLGFTVFRDIRGDQRVALL